MLKTIRDYFYLVIVTLIWVVCSLVALPMYPTVLLGMRVWGGLVGYYYSFQNHGIVGTFKGEFGSVYRDWKAALTGKLFK